MIDQASELELSMKPISELELKKLGATVDMDGVWTFPDRSRGRILTKPITIYVGEEKHEPGGLAFFERIEWVN